MKKITSLFAVTAAVVLLIAFTGCNKEPISAYVDLGEFSFTDSALVKDNYVIKFNLIKGSDVKSIFSAASIGDEELKRLSEIQLDSVSLVAGDGLVLSDWDFGDIYLKRSVSGNDSIAVASGTVDKTKTSVSFEKSFKEMKSYFDFNDFYIMTRLYRSKTASSTPRTIKGKLRFRVVIPAQK